jgi:hypothetical protein
MGRMLLIPFMDSGCWWSPAATTVAAMDHNLDRQS